MVPFLNAGQSLGIGGMIGSVAPAGAGIAGIVGIAGFMPAGGGLVVSVGTTGGFMPAGGGMVDTGGGWFGTEIGGGVVFDVTGGVDALPANPVVGVGKVDVGRLTLTPPATPPMGFATSSAPQP